MDQRSTSTKRPCRLYRIIIVSMIAVFIIAIGISRLVSTNYYHRLESCGFQPPVLLISLDGFRHDYLETTRAKLGQNALPNFARLEREGVRANYSVNVYPTITLPNHHTLVTGLYPESHGVVGNAFYDSANPNHLMTMDSQTSLNNDGWIASYWPEPIWVTLQRVGRWTGSMLWPLTDEPSYNDRPFQQVSQFTLLNSGLSRFNYSERVKTLLYWLSNEHFKLDFIMAYFDEPDETGHAYGPDSEEVAKKVQELDTTIGRLLDGLEALKLDINLIITADHGMARIGANQSIDLNEYVNSSLYKASEYSTNGYLYPEPGKTDSIYEKLKNVSHIQIYHREQVPANLNFNLTNSRMPDLLVLPEPHWVLGTHSGGRDYGGHGYSPDLRDMSPFLIARGPSFKVGSRVDKVNAIDIYALMSGLLHIAPIHHHNGSLSRIAGQLVKPECAHLLLTHHSFGSAQRFIADNVNVILVSMCVAIACCILILLLIELCVVEDVCSTRSSGSDKSSHFGTTYDDDTESLIV